MFSYEGLYRVLSERKMKISELTGAVGLSSRTIAKINRSEKVSGAVLRRVGEYFGCLPEELCEELSDNKILRTLREEKKNRISGGLYHELQVRMTYNSNHIEGSRLSEEQTRMIFETNTVDAGDGVLVDDVMETVHHFKAIDYCIDMAEAELSEDIIKHLHFMLMHDTKDAGLPWFAVGEYKKRPNMVGGRETVSPGEVGARMDKLLMEYNAKRDVEIQDIVALHAEFEAIHPFQDGNGRVGRLIALKECLRHDIVPFIIEDAKKAFYYRGLMQWESEKGYLMDTCLDGQDSFQKLVDYFGMGDG